MAKEFILLFFIIFVVLYYVSRAGNDLSARGSLAECYSTGHVPVKQSWRSTKRSLYNVNFAGDVTQRKYSKRTGRIIGADTMIPINDLLSSTV